MTATVTPPALSAPRCAAASMPKASPLMTTTPALASSRPSCSATASPYGEGRREPTIAARGPSGGGHRPRTLSSGRLGCDILQAEAERFQDVVLVDTLRAVEVGRGARHTPGPVEGARRHAPLRRPSFERPSGSRSKRRQVAQARGFQLSVQTALPRELALAGGD